MKIAVTGANSSVGQNLLAHVAASSDISVIGCVRSEGAAASLPRSPRIDARVISYDDVGDLAKAIEGASCIVHLAGILIESKTRTYASANVATTAAVVEASQKAGVQHVVLISVLGASVDSPNRFLRSKGEAERSVADSGISSSIIRTPILLGPGTAGASALVEAATRGAATDGAATDGATTDGATTDGATTDGAATAGRVSLLGGGRSLMRPLDVDDLSGAILRVCETRPEGGTIHELVGPESIPYRQLVTRAAGMMGNSVSISAIPLWIAKLGAAMTNRLGRGGISPTVIDVITADEVVQRNADTELGINLTPLSATLEKILPPQKTETS